MFWYPIDLRSEYNYKVLNLMMEEGVDGQGVTAMSSLHAQTLE